MVNQCGESEATDIRELDPGARRHIRKIEAVEKHASHDPADCGRAGLIEENRALERLLETTQQSKLVLERELQFARGMRPADLVRAEEHGHMLAAQLDQVREQCAGLGNRIREMMAERDGLYKTIEEMKAETHELIELKDKNEFLTNQVIERDRINGELNRQSLRDRDQAARYTREREAVNQGEIDRLKSQLRRRDERIKILEQMNADQDAAQCELRKELANQHKSKWKVDTDRYGNSVAEIWYGDEVVYRTRSHQEWVTALSAEVERRTDAEQRMENVVKIASNTTRLKEVIECELRYARLQMMTAEEIAGYLASQISRVLIYGVQAD